MPGFLDIPPRLCHGCGTCIAVCPQKALEYTAGRIILAGECIHCGACHRICPGIAVDFADFNKRLFPPLIPDPYFGCFQSMHLGAMRPPAQPRRVSSGGVVSALLSSAIEHSIIRGAIVCSMSETNPCETVVRIATTPREVLNAAGSKYTLVPVNKILGESARIKGPIALVGLPCHVHGLRKMQLETPELAAHVNYVIGLFCGFNLTPDATPFLLSKLRVNPDAVSSLSYRGGDWPGSFTVSTKDGHTVAIPKLSYNFLHLTHLPSRCALCPDLFAELADISVGDYWPEADAGRECSSIIVRTGKGKELLRTAAHTLEIGDLTPTQLYRSHAHLIQYKKRAITVRLSLSPTRPSFSLHPLPLSVPERISAALFCAALRTGRSRVGRMLLGLLPLSIPGYCARAFRGRSGKRLRKKGNRYWTLEDVARHWDATEDYDEINAETYSYARRFIDGYALCANAIRDNDRVLDIACRTGNGIVHFARRKKLRITGLDPSASMAVRCRKKLREGGIDALVEQWTDTRLPFSKHSFDIVTSFETLEHIFTPGAFLMELNRVLKPGGGLLLTTPNVLWDPLHTFAELTRLHHGEGPHRFLRRRELLYLLHAAGFAIVAEKSTVLIPYGPRWLTRIGEILECALPERLKRSFCLRRVLWCRKDTESAAR